MPTGYFFFKSEDQEKNPNKDKISDDLQCKHSELINFVSQAREFKKKIGFWKNNYLLNHLCNLPQSIIFVHVYADVCVYIYMNSYANMDVY